MQITGESLRRERQSLGLSQAKFAELCSVPQHILSAFELGKTGLADSVLEKVCAALSDRDAISKLASRTKRYQEHRYDRRRYCEHRAAQAVRTVGNAEYLTVLADLYDQHLQEKNGQLSALSLFSGCGGFSLGFSAAGFQIRGFVELDADARAIYKSNFPHCEPLGSDITQVNDQSLAETAERIGNIDVMIGGPPCQGFSLSGKRAISDPRNALFRHYLRFVDAFHPRMAVLENVRLLTSMKNPSGRLVSVEICEEFQKRGYNIRPFEINAKDYGVPQSRERVLFVAIRDTRPIVLPSLPDPTHGEAADMFSIVCPYRTFGDACSDLPYIESGEISEDPLHTAVNHPSHVIEWLWDVSQGCSAHDNPNPELRPPSGYNTTYKRQIWAEPASTVQTTFGMISGCRNVHPIATRSLTIREAARIQSFPDPFKFGGTLGAIRTVIGNAVPPLLAYHVALHLRNLLLD